MCTDPEMTGRAPHQKTSLRDTDEVILGGDNEGQVKQIRTGSHRKHTRVQEVKSLGTEQR